jgi:long-chain acyl-CoA synthetase
MNIFDIFRKRKEIPTPWQKFYTEEELNFKLPNISIYDSLRLATKRYSGLTALQYMGKDISYDTMMKHIEDAAKAFRRLGIKKGDIVTIMLPNMPEALYALYALNKLGAIGAMIHPLSAEEEIKRDLLSTKSKYLIMMDMFYNKIENVIWATDVKKVIFVSAADTLGTVISTVYNLSQLNKFKHHPKHPMFMSWRKFIKEAKRDEIVPYKRFGKDTPAVILHSGGTSGTPKNVVLQNRPFILLTKQAPIILKKLNPGDTVISILPNFHGFGLAITQFAPLTIGVKCVLIPKFDGSKFDVLFNKVKPNVILGVPTLFEALIKANNIPNLDLSFVKYAISGGDVLTKNLEDRVNEYFKKHGTDCRIVQGYGLTEALSAVALGQDGAYKSGSIGIPLPTNHIKIIDPATLKTMPYGEVGEICINNKGLMMGYLNNESETNAVLQMHPDGHVWLHTGDLGYMDDEGFVFVKGRSKRMIITSGYNVYPSHVEEVIESHPAVLQCTVVGVPHPYKQEAVKAFIVLKDGYNWLFVKKDIQDYCKKNLAKYMVPSEYVRRKALPKTKIGKVDFKALQSDIGADDED